MDKAPQYIQQITYFNPFGFDCSFDCATLLVTLFMVTFRSRFLIRQMTDRLAQAPQLPNRYSNSRKI
jgi:hypothetical protein